MHFRPLGVVTLGSTKHTVSLGASKKVFNIAKILIVVIFLEVNKIKYNVVKSKIMSTCVL